MELELIIRKERNEIYIDQITDDDVILVKLKGKILSTISKGEILWCKTVIGSGWSANNDLSAILNDTRFTDCKFSVLR